MINISEINKNKEISTGSKVKKTSSGESFSAYLNKVSQPENTPVSGVGALSGADVLLAAQMVDEEDERKLRQKVVERGKSLLEKLEEIRNALLIGSISKERLLEISRYVKEHHFTSDDPRLEEIIAEIELRVEVELAKLTR